MTPTESSLQAARRHPRSRLSSLPWTTLIALAMMLAISACSGGGGPNTKQSFRAVLIEPTPGESDRGCNDQGACLDTLRITFNAAIDTTVVLDDEHPRYFLATLSGGGFVLDAAGTTTSNPDPNGSGDRTLIIPFQFSPTVNYEFTLTNAIDVNGNPLENTASTSFTIGSCTTLCD